jgi:hypothetical protein
MATQTLLDGVTTTGAGTAIGAGQAGSESAAGAVKTFGVTIAYATAAPTAATIKLQGSNDSTTWVDLGETTDVSATSVGFGVADSAFSHIRGNLSSYDAGSCTGVTMKVFSI